MPILTVCNGLVHLLCASFAGTARKPLGHVSRSFRLEEVSNPYLTLHNNLHTHLVPIIPFWCFFLFDDRKIEEKVE